MTNLSLGLLMKLADEDHFVPLVPSSRKYLVNQITVSFLHLGGVDVYPIYPDLSRDEIRAVLNKVNGVLLPGGNTNVKVNEKDRVVCSMYAKAAKIIIEEAKAINDNGEYFPVFGICLGFQSMIAAEAEDINIVEKKDVGLGYNATLEYTCNYVNSKLLSAMPRHLLDYMGKVKSTHNYHGYSVDYDLFRSDSQLSKTYKVLSLSKSKDGTASFISMIEGNKYPFYGFQFHPEFAIQSYYPEAAVGYPSKNIAAEIACNVTDFIRREASKNSHKVSEGDEDKLLANNQKSIVLGSKYKLPYYLLE
eukprot:TRINITY_DN3585_c0_g1_i1.p1 TRINITY_DN3585_c0_g1~~TRINITY_DN3585_c0_g1_i1.p1  ORF type:complete len:305 (+),score=67.27 TRINITY_DN3585_c0_g1_i1:207-1121(+)